MTVIPRKFGQPMALKPLTERGIEFFNTINSIDTEEVLTRSKRINMIAHTAAKLTGERLQLEGDGTTKRLIEAAYLEIGDITSRVTIDTDPDTAEALLTSDQTHRTLLFASRVLQSYALDKATRDFYNHGTHFTINEDGLALAGGEETFLKVHRKGLTTKYKGCPMTKGNPEKRDLFVRTSDNIVRTYTQAHRQGMPANLMSQLYRWR